MAILTFLLSPLGRILAGAGGVFLIVFAFGAQQRSIGAAKAVAKIEKATDNAITKAHSAAAKSASGRGMLIQFRD